jgi:hypothetical protein
MKLVVLFAAAWLCKDYNDMVFEDVLLSGRKKEALMFRRTMQDPSPVTRHASFKAETGITEADLQLMEAPLKRRFSRPMATIVVLGAEQMAAWPENLVVLTLSYDRGRNCETVQAELAPAVGRGVFRPRGERYYKILRVISLD